jgi:hypothetical protein
MRLRLLTGVVLATACFAAGAPALGAPSQSQALFRQKLLDDPSTATSVKRLLRSNAGIVDPRSGFVDVTGDGRQDALVLVSTNGAAGTVALYVFSTHGQQPADGDQSTDLKVLFRLQALYRGVVRISGTSLTVLEPRWAKGDDLCCPAKLRQRVYAFDAARTVFARVDDRDIDGVRTAG